MLEMKAVPGSDGSQIGGLGLPVSEFSNANCGTTVEDGSLPPDALATAKSTAARTIQFCESTVNSLNPGSELSIALRSQERRFESSVATAGTLRPACLNAPKELARAAPKSVVIASIFGYLASSAVTTFCVCAGSQFVTLYGVWPMNLIFGSDLTTESMPWYSARLCEFAGGPPRFTTLPPFGSACLSQLPHRTPAWVKLVE